MTTIHSAAPSAAELVERYGEPDDIAGDSSNPSNVDRAGWAEAAFRAFVAQISSRVEDADFAEGDWSGTDLESWLGDLVCDLMHLATLHGVDAEHVLDSGRGHFTCEVGVGYER